MANSVTTPTAFVLVPSMMPRPILKDNFNVGYRKIPVLAIDREVRKDCPFLDSFNRARHTT